MGSPAMLWQFGPKSARNVSLDYGTNYVLVLA